MSNKNPLTTDSFFISQPGCKFATFNCVKVMIVYENIFFVSWLIKFASIFFLSSFAGRWGEYRMCSWLGMGIELHNITSIILFIKIYLWNTVIRHMNWTYVMDLFKIFKQVFPLINWRFELITFGMVQLSKSRLPSINYMFCIRYFSSKCNWIHYRFNKCVIISISFGSSKAN